MDFLGYKYTFRVNLSHSMSLENANEAKHMHTIEIAVFVKKSNQNESFVTFDDLERGIERYLKGFQGKFVNEIPPFTHTLPTIENMGYEFYLHIKEILEKEEFVLTRLEISEIPSRIFVISEFLDTGVLHRDASHKEQKLAQYIENNEARMKVLIENKRKQEQDETKNLEQLSQELELSSEDTIEEAKSANLLAAATTENGSGWRQRGLFWLAFALLVAVSACFIYFIYQTGLYPSGENSYLYLGKAEYLYSQMRQGNLAPIYMDSWYNGYQMFTTSSPLSYYVVTALTYLTGDILNSYLLYIAVVFLIGGSGWLLLGRQLNNLWVGFGTAILWFFLPENFRAFFVEGNLPYLAVLAMLPYLLYFFYQYQHQGKRRYRCGITFLTILMIVSHTYVAILICYGMAVLTLFTCLFEKKINPDPKERKYSTWFSGILSMVHGFVISLPWLYPAIKHGILKINHFGNEQFRFGFFVICIAVFGLILARKNSRSGFFTVLFMGLSVLGAFLPVIDSVPMGHFFLNINLATIAYLGLFLGLLEWKSCKPWIMLVLFLILATDGVRGLYPFFTADTTKTAYEREEEAAEEYGLTQALRTTKSRLMILDLSEKQSFPAYYAQKNGKKVNFIYDLENHGSVIQSNLNQMSYALYAKHYDYLFDRCFESGNDTILIKKKEIFWKDTDKENLKTSAIHNGYHLTFEDAYSMIFHRETPEVYGTVSDYKGIAIGKDASLISLLYPDFEEGLSDNLEDYAIEDLLQYEQVYLAGFTYNSLEKAEQIVKKLSKNGVWVLIDMNNIPIDKVTNRAGFLGVTAQTISFKEKFRDLIYQEQIITADSFYEAYPEWGTVYLDNLDTIEGYSWIGGKKLSFYGTKENENIHFLGFNLLYHAVEVQDEKVIQMFESILGKPKNTLPNRQTGKLQIQYNGTRLQIQSEYDNMNTAVAFQDTFYSKQEINNKNHMLQVNQGETTISFSYRENKIGCLLAVVYLLILGIYQIFSRYHKRKYQKLGYTSSKG